MSHDAKHSITPLLVFIILGAGALWLANPRLPKTAQEGDVVRLAMTVSVEGGGLVIDRPADTPLTTTLASPYLVEGIWKRIVGMREGERREFTVSPEEAYGDSGRGSIPTAASLDTTVRLLEVIERAAP